jgi:hypothetical protein
MERIQIISNPEIPFMTDVGIDERYRVLPDAVSGVEDYA